MYLLSFFKIELLVSEILFKRKKLFFFMVRIRGLLCYLKSFEVLIFFYNLDKGVKLKGRWFYKIIYM